MFHDGKDRPERARGTQRPASPHRVLASAGASGSGLEVLSAAAKRPEEGGLPRWKSLPAAGFASQQGDLSSPRQAAFTFNRREAVENDPGTPASLSRLKKDSNSPLGPPTKLGAASFVEASSHPGRPRPRLSAPVPTASSRLLEEDATQNRFKRKQAIWEKRHGGLMSHPVHFLLRNFHDPVVQRLLLELTLAACDSHNFDLLHSQLSRNV
eukprot:jgi/Botrbrau1/15444/Bobra.43_2s0069.1